MTRILIYGGLISFNPDVDFSYFPLENPGIISVPLAFLLGWLGALEDLGPAHLQGAAGNLERREVPTQSGEGSA